MKTLPSALTFSTEAIHQELVRITSSKTFRPADRLQRFLMFIAEEVIAGRGDRLKEYPIGVDVFEKEDSFDPRMDPIVRVQARRLRMRLATYYENEGAGDEILIELPKGGYAPTFRASQRVVAPKQIAPALVGRNMIAVANFSFSGDSEQEARLAKSVRQEILHALTNDDTMVLVSRSDSSTEGRETGAGAAILIGGSIRVVKKCCRISTHLIDTVRGRYVWSHTIDRSLESEPFAIEEEVAQSLVRVLHEGLRNDATQRNGWSHRSGSLAAHNLYLQGRYHLSQRTERGLHKALDFFEKTVVEDPKFAAGYAGIADAYGLLAHYGAEAPVEVWTKAVANASHAVLLDDNSSEAHTSLAHIKATQGWDWAGAEQDYLRGIALDPRNATAHHWYAVAYLAPLGRLDEALSEILIASELDPLSSIISRDIASVYYYCRQYEKALEQCDQTIEQNPHFAAAYWTLGMVQEQIGDFEEAIAAFRRAIELSPPSPSILGALGRALAKSGKISEAVNVLEKLKELAENRYVSPFELAMIYFALDRMDEGFSFLAKSFQDRCYPLISIRVDPRFDSVRDDPRYMALTGKLHLPQG